MNFRLQRLQQPLELKQVARDPAWDRFKTIMVVIGGILVFWMYGEKMFLWGRAGSTPTPAPAAVSQPAPVAPQPRPIVQPVPPPPPQPPAGPCDNLSPADTIRCEKRVLRK